MNTFESNSKENTNTSSDEEEEDEEAKELTDDVEKSFFKALSCLKKDDPKIYDESVKFFDSSAAHQNVKKSTDGQDKNSNPIYLEEYKRKILLERGPEFDDTKEMNDVLKKEKVRMSSPSYVEEQQAIKESFNFALNDNSDDEDILKPRLKTKEEQEKEEKDYLEWLKGNRDELEDEETKKDLQHLHDYWNNPNLDEGEQFLCDYILNKRFLEKPKEESLIEDEMRFSEEDEMLEKHEEFEHKYNFRFEEPDKEFIKTYPRTMENSLRRKEDKRKKKREELTERKKKELEKRSLEIKQLKKLKKKEIIDRIRKLQEITGNKRVGFEDTELEEDFNPTEYDRKMHELFDEEFYDKMDDEKPVFDEEEDEFIMDCDYDPSMDKRAKKQTRAAKRKEKKKLMVDEDDVETDHIKKIPKYNPANGSFEKYIDEYYSLDCEDVVSGVPTRFTYNKVLPNDYGLTIDEILRADDNELNKWYPLGKLTKIQPEAVQKFEAKIYKRKAKDIELKKKMLPSLFKEELNEVDETQEESKEVTTTTKKKKKKKPMKNVFQVEEVLPKSSDNLQNDKGNNSQQLTNKTKSMKITQSNSILKNVKKAENNKIDSTQSETKIVKNNKKTKDSKIENTQNENKIIKNNKKTEDSKTVQTQNKNKTIIKGEKRKLNHTQNGSHKKQKFSVKKYKPNKEPSALESMTDDRLKAYGINPKKFRNKLKFGNN
ncbi:protein KRI1 homolog [Aphis gossypii]|uniref:protein KRI1 homolog n=1 Tax=Aphis gossypii TaxID=80765 RepID=UPI00100DD466|nr:protein KRI1 homolog [Aphis gossypii]XP_027853278.1 protein KRI1 homolog [Aphis gossypii]XP_027853284.1 protein KRI1 homolog [Aphis gossypii]